MYRCDFTFRTNINSFEDYLIFSLSLYTEDLVDIEKIDDFEDLSQYFKTYSACCTESDDYAISSISGFFVGIEGEFINCINLHVCEDALYVDGYSQGYNGMSGLFIREYVPNYNTLIRISYSAIKLQ